MSGTKPWELSEELWQRAEPLITPPEGKRKLGRPRQSDRAMLGAILYVLRTGIQSSVGRSASISTALFSIWPVRSSAFSSVPAFAWPHFPNNV